MQLCLMRLLCMLCTNPCRETWLSFAFCLPALPDVPGCALLCPNWMQGDMAELRMLRKQRDALDDQIQRLEWQLTNANHEGEPAALPARLPAA